MSTDDLSTTRLTRLYQFIKKIGSGAFGDIYLGVDIKAGDYVAIKIESIGAKDPQLQHEARVYQLLQGGIGVPSLRWLGTGRNCLAMVTELLGTSLDHYLSRFTKFSLKTVLLLADQMICRLEFIHSCGFIHRDIKPGNFLMGRSSRAHEVYLIDFGLTRLYRLPHTGEHMGLATGRPLVGTPYYSSLGTHFGIDQTRKDDLEALGYMLVSFLLGQLPWLGVQGRTPEDRHTLILQCKLDYPPERLCQGLPYEFMRYLDYCRALGFSERPNYLYLRRLFKNLAYRKQIVYDYAYDWSRSSVTNSAESAGNFGNRS